MLVALRQWGDAWVADGQGPPVVARHKGCGAEVHAVLRCADGHDVHFEDSFVDAGPGLVRIDPDSPGPRRRPTGPGGAPWEAAGQSGPGVRRGDQQAS